MVALGSTTVYAIGPKGGPLKIGFANNLAKRLEALQVGNHAELFVHVRIVVPPETARKIETEVHARLGDRHERGEWFNVTVSDALAAINAATSEILEEWQGPLLRSGDQIEQLFATHKLSPWTREAIAYYRALATGTALDRQRAGQADAYVSKQAGVVAFNMLVKVVVEHKHLHILLGGKRSLMRRAQSSLADGVNALADWYALGCEARLLTAI